MQRTYQFSEIGPTRAQQGLIDLLKSVGHRQIYSRGKMITQQGDVADGFWLIETGEITIGRFSADGNLTVFAVLGAGDLVGDLACLSAVPRQVDAFAEEDAVLFWVDQQTVEQLLATEPHFSRWLLRSLATQLRAALDRVESKRTLSAKTRLARFIADLAHRDGPVIKVTHQALADFMGVSRVTIGDILSKLAAQGVLAIGYRQIEVIDEQKLHAVSQE